MVSLRAELKRAEQGAAMWFAREKKDSGTTISGHGKFWFLRDANIADLKISLKEYEKQNDIEFNHFYCEQYKKVGRKIDMVKVCEVDLSQSEIEWIDKVEQVEKIGLVNLKKGTELYDFMQENKKLYLQQGSKWDKNDKIKNIKNSHSHLQTR